MSDSDTARLIRQNALLRGISKIFQEALVGETVDEVAQRCLCVAEDLTCSQFGFVGWLNAAGRLDTYAMNNPGWSECGLPPADARRLLYNMQIKGIWGEVIRTGCSLITNDPTSHPAWCGIPEGHPEISSFLGVPLKERKETFGVIVLGNKETGYNPENREDIEALSHVFVQALLRKRDELALRESEQRYLQLLENTREWIWETDASGLYTYSNSTSKDLIGYEPDELVGKKYFYELFHPEYREELKQVALNEFTLKNPFQDFANRNVRKDGDVVWLSTSAEPILDDQGRLKGYRGTDLDITARKEDEARREFEAKVQQAQKLESLAVLAGGIAHDFNNLLMGILGNVELARMHVPDRSPAIVNIDEIERSAKRAAELSRQMLAYSGKNTFLSERIDLSEMVNEMEYILKAGTAERAALKYDLTSDLPAILGDSPQIRQVIMNIITNAVESISEKNGIISITTGAMECSRDYLKATVLDEELPEGTYVFIEVADTGCGMDEPTLSRMFDPFFSTKFTGRGLGLAAVLGIVRGHKGALTIYSETGRGTSFKALFPACSGPPPRTREREAIPVKRWQGSTVLLIDDDRAVRTVSRKMLEKVGFAVLTAGNGREGVEVFEKNADRITCVFLDLTMPEMGGAEAYRHLRRINSDVPVILTSGYNEKDAVRNFPGKGLAGFMQKPYQLRQIITKLSDVLDR